MQIKSQLRKELLLKRKCVTEKSEKETKINSLICVDEFIDKFELILFYSALGDEVNLMQAIQYAFEHSKKIAFPYCIDKNGNMLFYYVNSPDDFVEGSFGILEPDIRKCIAVDDFTSAICFVPAISFDKKGYRLGYGKGYYDRFLSTHNVYKAGICFDELIVDNLPVNEYDIAVDVIISENGYTYID